MNRFKESLSNERGSSGIGIIIAIVVFILMILPVLSQVMERNRVNIVRNDTVTAVDLSLKSALIALDLNQASAEVYDFNNSEFNNLFQHYLSSNMNLNPDLTVTDDSLVDGDVTINSIQYHGTDNLPYTSPVTGRTYNRPYFSVELVLIIKPSLFRKMIHDLVGIDEFHYTFYYDVSMPVNN